MKLTIEIHDETAIRIKDQIANMPKNEHDTHGPLTLKRLVEMLVEDVDLSIRRPGSWEGSKMGDLLTSHGYQW